MVAPSSDVKMKKFGHHVGEIMLVESDTVEYGAACSYGSNGSTTLSCAAVSDSP